MNTIFGYALFQYTSVGKLTKDTKFDALALRVQKTVWVAWNVASFQLWRLMNGVHPVQTTAETREGSTKPRTQTLTHDLHKPANHTYTGVLLQILRTFLSADGVVLN